MSFVLTFRWDLWQKQQHCVFVTLIVHFQDPCVEPPLWKCCFSSISGAAVSFILQISSIRPAENQMLPPECGRDSARFSLWYQYWNWTKSKFPNIYKQRFFDWCSLSCRCNNILPPYSETCFVQGTALRFSQICCVRDYSGTNRSKIGLQLCPGKELRRRTNGMNKKMKNKWRPDRER